jgi:hypothetical protein
MPDVKKWRTSLYAPPQSGADDEDPFPWLLAIFEASSQQVFAYPTEAEARTTLAQLTLAHSRAL